MVRKEAAGEQQGVPNPPGAAKETAAGALVTVILAILPWGEVYVDGRKRGVAPPLRSLQLTPGRHEIEIRNTTFPRHVEKIDATPGAAVTIKHRFK